LPPELVGLLSAEPAHRAAAWSAFLQAFSDLIMRVARSLGGDHDAVMDRYAFVLDQLGQDDCRRLRAYERPTAGEFNLWLIVVSRRLCLDHHRARYGRARATDVVRGNPAELRRVRRRLTDLVVERLDPAATAAPAGTRPDEVLAQGERDRKISLALQALDPRDRLLLRLRFTEEMSAREIGELMGFPTAFHVYRRLDALLHTLRTELERLGLREVEP
jgi:RNA polymerase sigma factor (sigma-70 family)